MNFNQHNQEFRITGMSCKRCQAAVESAISSVPGVSQTQVKLAEGQAIVQGSFSNESIIQAVQQIGYEAEIQPNEGGLAT